MAIGDLLGTLSGNAVSITNPFDATGSVAVAVGDLVVAALAEQNNLTVTTLTDNLGNTYTALNAGTDPGGATSTTLRTYYSRVTVAGTLTTVSAAATASNDDVAFVAAVFQGPFGTSPLDANPANNSNTDNASPFTCPATGTLTQASELVISVMSGSGTAAAWLATSPNLKAVQTANGTNGANVILGYQMVSATTTISPEFTGTNPTTSVQATFSFKASQAITLAADVGAFTLTGIAALQKLTFNAAVGAFTLTGVAAVLSKGYVLVAAVGSFLLTGIAALQKLTFNAAVGAFTLTGIDAILSKGYVLVAAVGAFTLTGIAVVWQRSMNAAVGAFTLTGIDVTLQAIRTMTAAVGTFVFTGVAATLTSGRTLTAAVGTFVLTGVANIMGKSALDLTYRLKRRATTILAKVRAAEPVLSLRRVVAPALKKLRSRDPSLSQ